MIISSSVITAAKRRGSKKLAESAQPGERFTQVEAVVELLGESTSPAAQRGARILLKQMSTQDWCVIRGAHRSSDDPNLHVTIDVAATRYHLRLDGRSCVFDITRVVADQTERPAGGKPWVKPGA